MYDSINLPLSPWKILKKVIYSEQDQPKAGGSFKIYTRNTRGNTSGLGIIFLTGFAILLTYIFPQSQHPFKLSSATLVAIILTVSGVLIAVLAIYQYYYYKLYYYRFGDDLAEIRKGVISRATGNVRYEKIQNVYVDQDFLDRIFGLYDVHYETAGESSGFYSHVDGLNQQNANLLTNFLNEKCRQNAAKSTVSQPNAGNA